MTTRRALVWIMVSLCLVGAFLFFLMLRTAHAQSMGVLSTPVNVAAVAVDASGSTQIVAAQGSGVKIRVLGYFLSADRQVNVRWQDGSAVALTGKFTIATGVGVNVPVSPPGYIGETTANTALNLTLVDRTAIVGGFVIWQAAQ